MKKLFNQRGAIDIILIVVVFVLAAGLGGYVYYRQQQNNKAIDSASGGVTVASRPSGTTASTPSNTTVFKIPELGVQIMIPKTLTGLIYHSETMTSPSGVTAEFSTTGVKALDAACSEVGPEPPLGIVTKVNGQYPTNPTATNSGGSLIKQFPNYYIGYTASQSQCSDKAAVSSLLDTQKPAFVQALKSVTEIK